MASTVVVKICSAVLSDLLQITSSRQSPRISALNAGFDFVPLFEEQSEAVSTLLVVLLLWFHLSM